METMTSNKSNAYRMAQTHFQLLREPSVHPGVGSSRLTGGSSRESIQAGLER